MSSSFLRGWAWLVNVANHIGAALLVLASAGFLFLSWTSDNWWFTAFFVLGVAFVCFAEGSYEEYRAAQNLTGEAIGISLRATLSQLRAKRAQANEWLRKIRDDDLEGTSLAAIEQVFSVFWTQQVVEAIQARFPNLAPMLGDQSDPLVTPANERERVFNTIQRAVQKLEAVIAEIEETYQSVLHHIGQKG